MGFGGLVVSDGGQYDLHITNVTGIGPDGVQQRMMLINGMWRSNGNGASFSYFDRCLSRAYPRCR